MQLLCVLSHESSGLNHSDLEARVAGSVDLHVLLLTISHFNPGVLFCLLQAADDVCELLGEHLDLLVGELAIAVGVQLSEEVEDVLGVGGDETAFIGDEVHEFLEAFVVEVVVVLAAKAVQLLHEGLSLELFSFSHCDYNSIHLTY